MGEQALSQLKQSNPPSFMPVLTGYLQRKCATGNHTIAGGECEECGKKQRLGLQTKLTINEPGDSHEVEEQWDGLCTFISIQK